VRLRNPIRLISLIVFLIAGSGFASAQRLPLPSALFVLTNEGRVERYGLDAAGAQPVTPASDYVIDFGIDALGERMAYRTEAGLKVVGLSGGDGILLEGPSASLPPFRGSGDTIAWSPTGDALAYTTLDGMRVYLEGGSAPTFINLTEGLFRNLSWSPTGTFIAGQTDQDVWWIYRRDGLTLSLASVIDSSIGTAWVSSSEIVFAPREGGLKLMNLDAANAQTTLLDASGQYRLPTLTMSDALVFFGRTGSGDSEPEIGTLLRLQRGAPRVETIGQQPVPLDGLQWAPGGEVMTVLQGGALALFDPVTGVGTPLPVNNVVALDWAPLPPPAVPPTPVFALPTEGPSPVPTVPPTETPSPLGVSIETVTALTLTENAYFIADVGQVAQGWQLPANGSPPFRFTGASVNISEIAPAPDNSGLVYVSDGLLWFQPFVSSRPLELAELNGFAPITPSVRPDGAQVAYTDETTNGGGIWTVGLDGNPPVRLLASTDSAEAGADARTFRRPQYSPDGLRLLVDAYAGDAPRAVVYSFATDTRLEIEPEPDDPRPRTARWLNDGRIVMWRDATMDAPEIDTGLYIYDSVAPELTPVEWVPLPEDAVVRDVIQVAPGNYRVLLTSAADALVRVVDLRGFDAQVITAIDNLQAPRLSPDGRFVAGYESLIDNNADGVPEGPLIVADLERGGVFRIAEPAAVWNFRWVGS
jgi:hypothetical protein